MTKTKSDPQALVRDQEKMDIYNERKSIKLTELINDEKKYLSGISPEKRADFDLEINDPEGKTNRTKRVNLLLTEETYEQLKVLQIVMGGVSANEAIYSMVKPYLDKFVLSEDYQDYMKLIKKYREKNK